MSINPFRLERYFARYEFKVKYLLSPSDCESLSMTELLGMASPASLELWQGLNLHYTESQGLPLLRAEVARLYRNIPADNVLIAAPEEAIFIAMQTLLRPGDQVVAISPAYQSLHEIARSIGCEVIPWPMGINPPEHWRLDLARLENLLSPRTRMLIINFPHNPTGFQPERAELEALIDLARQHDLFLFSDEMYRLLEHKPSTVLPAVCDLYEKGISLSGLSKSFALPGLRIGWLASQAAGLLELWLGYHDYTTICNSAPGEILAVIALQNKERILQRNQAIVLANLAFAEQFFNGYTQYFRWFPPTAGSVAFPEWLGKEPVEQFCQNVLEQRGVMIVPGNMFDYVGNHFRIGLGRRNLPEALAQVAGYLEKYPVG